MTTALAVTTTKTHQAGVDLLRLSPLSHGTDGFFAAVLRKKAE